MNCEGFKDSLSAYVDDELDAATRRLYDAHLNECPVCRGAVADTRLLARRVAALTRPAPPADLAAAISNRLHTERAVLTQASLRSSTLPLWSPVRILDWFAPRMMPFSVGAFASIILFIAVFGALLPSIRALHVLEQTRLLASALPVVEGEYDVTKPITMHEYVASRTPFTSVSPSLDPRGALVAASPYGVEESNAEEDDMIIVADVFSDGKASLAGVVTPPRDARMLSDLDTALRRTPAFVPARVDHRPPTMRVVFMVQRMNVRDRVY